MLGFVGGGAYEPQNNANYSIAVLDRFVMHVVPNPKVILLPTSNPPPPPQPTLKNLKTITTGQTIWLT
jgi:hypothetical protein